MSDPVNGPIPTRLRMEGESGSPRQTPRMRLVDRRLLEMADDLGTPLGMGRRRFLQSSCGMAAGFLALNSVFGPLFAVAKAEAADPDASAARKEALRDQIIIDVQTHFVSPGYASTGILGLRELARRWNPQIEGEQTLEDLRFENFFQEIFEQSETSVAVLSNAPNDDRQKWFLENSEVFRARERVRERTGSKRLYAHALFTPGRPGWLEDLDRLIELRPDAWKGYTTGQPIGESRWPWRLDDENLVYPAYEKMVKSGIRTVCLHKGLLPSNFRQRMPSNWRYANVDDLGKAAKDWPQLDFLIYHSAIQSGGIPTAEALKTFEETGYIPWVSDLAQIPEKYGVNNVYAELGSVFAVTSVSAPRYCAGILGTLLKGMGEERVLWGTDSVWYGSPQWQIEALRRLEMPEDLQKRFAYRALGPADGPLKNRIFSGNAARAYGIDTEELTKSKA